jgi:regulation of enolase protein 1 (concanavalin A-like superfamily)
VGNTNPPFAERTTVHGGRQAMPFGFDNSRSPFYSETVREWPTAQSWTAGATNTLRVYLRGDAAAFLETSPGNYIMNGTGTDIWDASDQFRFVYKQLKGNGTIVARVDAVALTNEWSKAGVMIRETVEAGSPHAFVAATPTPSHGVSFQRRTDTGGTSANTDVANATLPHWVKITRNGSTFTAQESADGVKWVDIVVTPAVSITMGNDVYIGLAVTSHATGVVCGAKFSNVSTTGTVTGSWQVAEIGVAQLAGNTPETFYVAVQDSAGKTKMIANPDPAVIATGNWEEWSIPFSEFTSAGINMNGIKKMMLGVGNPSAPKAGGAGKLYIDDIRLPRVGP